MSVASIVPIPQRVRVDGVRAADRLRSVAWDSIYWAVLHEPTAATKRQIQGEGVVWNLLTSHIRITAVRPRSSRTERSRRPKSTDSPLGIRHLSRDKGPTAAAACCR